MKKPIKLIVFLAVSMVFMINIVNAENQIASGNVTNTATVIVPLSVDDPTPAYYGEIGQGDERDIPLNGGATKNKFEITGQPLHAFIAYGETDEEDGGVTISGMHWRFDASGSDIPFSNETTGEFPETQFSLVNLGGGVGYAYIVFWPTHIAATIDAAPGTHYFLVQLHCYYKY